MVKSPANTRLGQPMSGSDQATRFSWGQLCFVVAVLVGFHFFKTEVLYAQKLKFYFIFYGVTALLGGLFFRIKAEDLPASYRIVLRGCLLVFTMYLSGYYLNIPASDLDDGTRFFLGPMRWLTFGLGVVAWFRPTFALMPFLYTAWSKRFFYLHTGIPITGTDYFPVLESGVLLTLGVFAYGVYERLFAKRSSEERQGFHPLLALLYCAIGVHLANYFYSGLQKLVLDGRFALTWLIQNPTYYLMLNANYMQVWPVTILMQWFPWFYPLVRSGSFMVNFLTLLTQLAALIVLLRPRWVLWLTVFFDLTHIAVFLVSGIFFWKWIIFNLSIVWAMRVFPEQKLPKVWPGVAAICLLLAPTVFFTARLGWYDTRSDIMMRVDAVTDQGEVYRVPYNYFLAPSVTFAQNRIGNAYTNGFGTDFTKLQMERRNHCELAALAGTKNVAKPVIMDASFEQFKKFMLLHQRYTEETADSQGRMPYNLFFHHIWSDPWGDRDFYELDKRRIQKYRLNLEAVCLDYQDGRVTSQVLFKDSRDLSVLKLTR